MENTTRKLQPRRWGISLIVIVLLVSGLVAPLVQAAQDDQPLVTVLKIGYLGEVDSDAFRGAKLAVEQINMPGGFRASDDIVYQLELVTPETPPTAATLPNAIDDLMANAVVAILGPDDNALLNDEGVTALLNTQRPILTGATLNTLTANDPHNIVFRIRAPEQIYSAALAAYLRNDLGFTSIAMVLTGADDAEAAALFEAELKGTGINPAENIQDPGSNIAAISQQLIQKNPEAVVMWGTPENAVALLAQLRDGGWVGRFVYPQADQAARAGILPDTLANGVIGVSSWSYAYPGLASRIFLQDYMITFGDIPGPLAAAAYDAVWFLQMAIAKQGSGSDGFSGDVVRVGLFYGAEQTLVQGTLRPLEYNNGDLIRTAVIYELGPHGGPRVVARYDNAVPLAIQDAGPQLAQAPFFTLSGPMPGGEAPAPAGITLINLQRMIESEVQTQFQIFQTDIGVTEETGPFVLDGQLSGTYHIEQIVNGSKGTAVESVGTAMINAGMIGQVIFLWSTGSTCAEHGFWSVEVDFNLFDNPQGPQKFIESPLYIQTMQNIGIAFEPRRTGLLATNTTTHACGASVRYNELIPVANGRYLIATNVVVSADLDREEVLTKLDAFNVSMIDLIQSVDPQ